MLSDDDDDDGFFEVLKKEGPKRFFVTCLWL